MSNLLRDFAAGAMRIITGTPGQSEESKAVQGGQQIASGGDLISLDAMNQSGISAMAKTYQTFCDAYAGWVYSCIDRIATTVATLPLKLYAYKRQGKYIGGMAIKQKLKSLENAGERRRFMKAEGIEREEIFEHPFYDLMKRPNLTATRYILWVEMMTRLELTGTCPIYVVANSLGMPAELWPLPMQGSAQFKVIPDPEKIYGAFEMSVGNKRTRFDPDEIIFMRYPDPASPFKGFSPLLAQTYPYDIDDFLSKQQYALLKNKTIFGTVLSTEQNLNKAQQDNLKTLLKSQKGALKAGEPVILANGLELSSTTQSNRDMLLDSVAQYAQDKILSAYGTPAGKLGLVKDVNRANGEFLNDTFIRETIKPKTMLIEEYLEGQLLPRYDERLTADFELPDFSDKEYKLERDMKYIETGRSTINEIRDRNGEDPVPWGDAPWFQISKVQPGKEPPQSDNNKPEKSKGYYSEEACRIMWKEFARREERFERLIQDKVSAYFSEQRERVVKNILEQGKRVEGQLAGWSQKKIAAWIKNNKAKLDDMNIDPDADAELLRSELEPEITYVLREAGTERLSQLVQLGVVGSDGVQLNVNDPAVNKWLGDRLDKFSKEVTGTTFDKIKAVLREDFQDGAPVNVIADHIREKFASFEKYRAPLIARTETAAAMNRGDITAVRQEKLENKLKKFWLFADGEARDAHLTAGAQYTEQTAIAIDAKFEVGGELMDAPGNGVLPENNINCRCTLGYVPVK